MFITLKFVLENAKYSYMYFSNAQMVIAVMSRVGWLNFCSSVGRASAQKRTIVAIGSNPTKDYIFLSVVHVSKH